MELHLSWGFTAGRVRSDGTKEHRFLKARSVGKPVWPVCGFEFGSFFGSVPCFFLGGLGSHFKIF